jgi:hypothetical protein
MPEPVHRGGSSPDDYTIAELHSIVTRKFANGDDYARGLLRDQVICEVFAES